MECIKKMSWTFSEHHERSTYVLCLEGICFTEPEHFAEQTLPKKCQYSELFWSVFSRIWTEYEPE